VTTHTVCTFRVNIAAPDKTPHWRHRGRCSCGWATSMNYETPAAAETAVRRVHITDVSQREGVNA